MTVPSSFVLFVIKYLEIPFNVYTRPFVQHTRPFNKLKPNEDQRRKNSSGSQYFSGRKKEKWFPKTTKKLHFQELE